MEDGLRTGVESGRGQLVAQLHYRLDQRLVNLMRTGSGAVRSRLQARWSVAPIAGQQLGLHRTQGGSI
jgi:hypothetical protein